MATQDAIVIGGGISGATLAYHAARAGRRVLWVEKAERLGGCIRTVRTPAGFWFELGAHTCYNSYGALLEVLEGLGLFGELQARGKPHMRFLDGDALVPGSNLGALLRLFDKWELLRSLPRILGARQAGETVYSHYSRLVGRGNYGRVLGPVLSAVPSQTVDAFPADMLFKKRPRRKEVLRSFTLRRGLASIPEAVGSLPGVEVRLGVEAARLEQVGDAYRVQLSSGERLEAPRVGLAVTPAAAALLLREVAPEVASLAARVREAVVDTLGFAVPAGRVRHLPPSTFLIPLDDAFHSVVTRDPVPDPDWRGFAFHFRPGLAPEERLRRAVAVLGLQPGDLTALSERRTVLPSPVLGHQQLVAELDGALQGSRLAVTGNWFAGLSLEDCAQRSRSEWARVAGG